VGIIETIPIGWRRAGLIALAVGTLLLLTLLAYRL
jgi:hypothetical protein